MAARSIPVSIVCTTLPEHARIRAAKWMKSTLAPHQETAVTWMLAREERTKLSLLPQFIDGNWMPRVREPRGGILADDMGLGKTVSCLALISVSPDQSLPTLIVAPLSLLDQWIEECHKHCAMMDQNGAPSDFRVTAYRGRSRQECLEEVFFHNRCRPSTCFAQTEPDSCPAPRIVVTTYDVVRSEYASFLLSSPSRSSPYPGLFGKEWQRVVLDEAHCIRTPDGITANSVCALHDLGARWAVTGTPFSNKISDVMSLCRFVGVEPWCRSSWWKSTALAQDSSARLSEWRESFLLRRTKEGSGVVRLPPKTMHTIYVTLDLEEKRAYDRVCAIDAAEKWCRSRYGGVCADNDDNKNNHHDDCDRNNNNDDDDDDDNNGNGNGDHKNRRDRIPCRSMVHALQLRQACTHEGLVSGSKSGTIPTRNLKSSSNLLQGEQWMNGMADASWFGNGSTGKRPGAKARAVVDYCSLPEHAREEKFVVFSQWTKSLAIVAAWLNVSGFACLRYDGSLDAETRSAVLRRFRDSASERVLLCSLSCAAVGLNITRASHAIFLDSWFNPALEDQAIDRLHRMGQTRPVHVVKIISRERAEADVIATQDSKRRSASALLGCACNPLQGHALHCPKNAAPLLINAHYSKKRKLCGDGIRPMSALEWGARESWAGSRAAFGLHCSTVPLPIHNTATVLLNPIDGKNDSNSVGGHGFACDIKDDGLVTSETASSSIKRMIAENKKRRDARRTNNNRHKALPKITVIKPMPVSKKHAIDYSEAIVVDDDD